MKRFRFFLRLAAVVALGVLSAASLVNYAIQTQTSWNSYNHFGSIDDVTRWENRLADVKAHIPADAGKVGYISGDPQWNEFILTQYTIIPLVLEQGTGPDWIIANYPGKAIHQVLEKQLGNANYSVYSFGYGLYLIHKK